MVGKSLFHDFEEDKALAKNLHKTTQHLRESRRSTEKNELTHLLPVSLSTTVLLSIYVSQKLLRRIILHLFKVCLLLPVYKYRVSQKSWKIFSVTKKLRNHQIVSNVLELLYTSEIFFKL